MFGHSIAGLRSHKRRSIRKEAARRAMAQLAARDESHRIAAMPRPDSQARARR
jgi:hypothetical protein